MSLNEGSASYFRRVVIAISILGMSACGTSDTSSDTVDVSTSASATSPATYTAAQVTEACDRVIAASRDSETKLPAVAFCVGRGEDGTSIKGLSVAIEPEKYAKLSETERSAAEADFAEDARMPVSLKSGSGPTPLLPNPGSS